MLYFYNFWPELQMAAITQKDKRAQPENLLRGYFCLLKNFQVKIFWEMGLNKSFQYCGMPQKGFGLPGPGTAFF